MHILEMFQWYATRMHQVVCIYEKYLLLGLLLGRSHNRNEYGKDRTHYMGNIPRVQLIHTNYYCYFTAKSA